MNNLASLDQKATTLTRNRYQRLSPWYDRIESRSERNFGPWRMSLWQKVIGPKVLEVGVGTGKNMPYYPPDLQITALDLTPGMLERAQKRAAALHKSVDLSLGDVQNLRFLDNTFDTVVATFVFCSVPDPIRGLREVNRVVKPGGWIILLEHVRIDRPIIGRMMDLLNPLVSRITGANINRNTVETVIDAGICIESVEHLGTMQMIKLIVARPNKVGKD
jgi:ubiquinone/menaquinone biosynthesis C-methylase UbiE